jgi:hypothetical protein
MANDEHVALLKQGEAAPKKRRLKNPDNQGVAAWNEWRLKNPDIRPDLSGADLREANLDVASGHRRVANLSGPPALRQLELIFDRKSNYISPCLLVENVAALVVQKEAGR